jgi:hypothetical protein
MLAMTSAALPSSQPLGDRPAKAPPPSARRLVLVPAAATGRGDELVRRYRLARLRLEPRDTRGAERFAHLRDFHD